MRDTLAMSSSEHTDWLVANIVGLIFVVAAAALLTLLIMLVKTIDRRVLQVKDTLKAAEANTADTVLIPRVATEADVAGPVVFLASEASGYMTGQTISFDGGKFFLG